MKCFAVSALRPTTDISGLRSWVHVWFLNIKVVQASKLLRKNIFYPPTLVNTHLQLVTWKFRVQIKIFWSPWDSLQKLESAEKAGRQSPNPASSHNTLTSTWASSHTNLCGHPNFFPPYACKQPPFGLPWPLLAPRCSLTSNMVCAQEDRTGGSLHWPGSRLEICGTCSRSEGSLCLGSFP